MEINLINKKALVGASSDGIGAGIAQVLASCGASVTLVAHREEKLLEQLKHLDTTRGQKHQYLVADYTNFKEYRNAIDGYLETNQVDILVNNSNGPKAGTVFEKSVDDYQQAFELLFQNHVYTTLKVLPYMRQQKFGRIINVSSLTVQEPSPNLVLSNTIRTALVTWSKSLSQEVAADGITVNSILTGMFDTARIRQLTALEAEKRGVSYAESLEKRIENIPAKRLGLPEEYGYLVSFLSSDYAAYLTGTAFPLDGGASSSL